MRINKKLIAWITLFWFLFNSIASAVVLNIWWKTYDVPSEWISAIWFAKKNKLTTLNLTQNLDLATTTLKRFQWALLFKRNLINALWKTTYVKSDYECHFDDIWQFPQSIQQEIIDSCRLWLFKWSDWHFYPNKPLYKSSYLVVLSRMLNGNPNIELDQAIQDLKEKWIFKWNKANIYRPVTRIESLILFKRWDSYYKKNNVKQTNATTSTTNTNNLSWNNSNLWDINWLFDNLFWWTDENTWTSTNTWNNSIKLVSTTWSTVKTTTWSNIVIKNWSWSVNTWNKVEKKALEISYENWNFTRLPLGSSNLIVKKIKLTVNDKWKIWSLEKVNLSLLWLNDRQVINKIYLINKNYETISTDVSFDSDKKATLLIKRWFTLNTWDNNLYLAVSLSNNTWYNNQSIEIKWTLWFEKEISKNDLSWSLTFETNSLTTVNYTAQKVTVDWYTVPEQKVYIWDENKLVWSFRLVVWSNWESTKSVSLSKIIMKNTDNIDDVLANVKLEDSNWKTYSCELSKIEKDEVVCNLNNLVLNDWQSLTFNIYANIVGWEWKEIKFGLDLPKDLVWFESDSNIPIRVTKSNSAEIFKQFKIYAWKITIYKVASSPVWTTIPVDSTNNEILRFKIYSPSNIFIDNLEPYLTIWNQWTSSISLKKAINSITLYKCDQNYSNCTSIDSMTFDDKTIPASSSATIQLKSYLSEIQKWDNYYSIKINLSRYSDKISLKTTVNDTSLENPENSQWDNISSTEIVWSAEWWTFFVDESTITASYSNNELLEYVVWKKNIIWGYIQFTNSNIEPIKLESLRLKFVDSAWNVNYNQITNVRLITEDWKTVWIQDSDSNWYVYFTNLNEIIDKWSTLKLKVVFDTTQNLFTNNVIHNLTFKVVSNTTSDVLLTTSNWLVLPTNNIIWFPISSSPIKFYPYWKVYLFRDSATPNSTIIYNTNENNYVYSFKLKSRYDDIRVQDLYLIATDDSTMKYIVTWWDVMTWTENYINNITISDGTISKNAPIINWVAKFLWINLEIPANDEKIIKVYLKPNKINWIDYDNKKIKLSLILKYENNSWNTLYKTKFISLSNWEEITSWYIITWDNLLSNEMLIRWNDLKYSYDLSSSEDWRTEVNSDWDQDLYWIKITNLSSVNVAKIKQLSFKTTVTNVTWTKNLVINNFKLYISTDWWDSRTNRSDIKNDVEFATWLITSNSSWNSTWEISVGWSKTLNTYIHVRFTWDYINWYTINPNNSVLFKLVWNVSWLDNNSETIQIEVKENTDPNADNWEMETYSTFATWVPANNSIIWSDNIDSDWLTATTDKNWFEDYTLWDIDTQRILYKSSN